MARKKKNPTGASAAAAKKGKRKDPPADGAKKPSGRKRRKSGDSNANANSNSTSKRAGKFYYCEGEDPDELCNLLLEKHLAEKHTTANANANANAAPFEYTSGTDPNGSIYTSAHGSIPTKETNLLVGRLSLRELQMWSSSLGANYASKGFCPANIGRKLGKITRRLWLPCDTSKNENQIPLTADHHPWHPMNRKTMKWQHSHTTATPPSLGKVTKELAKNHNGLLASGDDTEGNHPRGACAATDLVNAWKKSLKQVGRMVPNWNRHGELPIVPFVQTQTMASDENGSDHANRKRHNNSSSHTASNHRSLETSSIVTIRTMLQTKLWLDDTDFCPFQKELYHLKIPTDTLSVLTALEALAKPDPTLYDLPLVLAIPILEPISVADSGSTPAGLEPWRLTISIFCHRLLFECMTTDALRIVMAALDEEESQKWMGRPLVKSPAAGPIVFGKDPKTKVEMIPETKSEEDDGSIVVIDDSSGEDEELRTRSDDTLDAFSTEGFLKLIENQGVSGVDTIYKNKIEPVLFGGRNPLLRVNLLPHQIHGVCWMYQMETLDEKNYNGSHSSRKNNPSLGLNGLLWERRKFREGDTYYYSPALGQARLSIGEVGTTGMRKQGRRGGILADEMGLGKTVQALALVLATLEDLRNETAHREEMRESNRDNDGDVKKNSHATLIIVPPALVGQWRNEIRKIAGDNLLVQFLDHKEQNERVELDPAADVVLTTYQVLESKGKKTARKYTQSRNVLQILSGTRWGRIILDEMQEVRSWNTTVSKTCQELESNRRWMLSGTPLWEGIQDFKGELCFLGLEPFAANNEDGFFDFAIANHWKARSQYGLEILRILSLVMLRRTKSMSILESGLPLLGLKGLTLVFEPVPQDPPERAMYCFLESVMHSTLMDSKDAANATATRKTKMNRLIFLRLLRELCVSPYLINGGLGCSSQLGVFNRLMKEYNRKQLLESSSPHGTHGNGADRFYSCDEAIQFLSQVEDMARTDSDFVTDTRLGGGGGISRRNRALLINPQERVQNAKETIANSRKICREARSSRAKAWWQWALEGVTTGRLRDKSCYDAASPSLVQLWNWRNRIKSDNTSSVLSFLNRGFRPTEKYWGLSGSNLMTGGGNSMGKSKKHREREEKLFQLGKRRPEFRWAHPFAVHFSNIPTEVSERQLQESIEGVIASGLGKIFRLRECSDSNTWEAIVQFSNEEDFDIFEKRVKKVDGAPLNIQKIIPRLQEEIEAAAATYQEAEAMLKVHPCELNERNLTKARAAYKKSKLGLRILDKTHHRSGQILCSRAFGNFRGTNPKTWEALFRATLRQIEDSTAQLAEHEVIIAQQEKTIKSMQNKMQLNIAGTGVENLNTVDVLQALKKGETDKATCPICYDDLGEGEGSNGKVSLTRCGHMSCKSCLKKWVDQKQAEGSTISCIECRKPIRLDQLICVDPKKVDTELSANRRKEAHVLVQQAAKKLEENYGQLEPHLWEALYLVIDLPPGIDQNLHGKFTAIPGLFLGHLRQAIGNYLPIESLPNQRSIDPDGKISLPSKFRALLTDLPRDELSVVFASSKSIVLHLQHVLEREGFGCKTLFMGQSEKESESAVSDWESPSSEDGKEKAATVLIVQAGAAACGLTLTAASHMFIIEPFRKHEEEKQAYARLHRFGQKKAVSCKVYYTPVSVESRLLEWRRRAKTHASEEEKTVYAPLRHSHNDNDDDENDDDASMDEDDSHRKSSSDDQDEREKDCNGTSESETIAEENQTRFLLGLESSDTAEETPGRTVARSTAESPVELTT